MPTTIEVQRHIDAKYLTNAQTLEAAVLVEGALGTFTDPKDLDLLVSMAGMEDDTSMNIRERIITYWENIAGSDKEIYEEACSFYTDSNRDLFPKYLIALAKSLTGCNSERAWQLRDTLLMHTKSYSFLRNRLSEALGESLAGVDDPRAEEFRQKIDNILWRDPEFDRAGCRLRSYACCNSTNADALRQTVIWTNESMVFSDLALSLTGIDNELAWALREILLVSGHCDRDVLKSLRTIDCERAWVMRRNILNGVSYNLRGDSHERSGILEAFLESLAGCNSEEAWAVRKKYAKSKNLRSSVARSLAGLQGQRVTELIELLEKRGISRRDLIVCLKGDNITHIALKIPRQPAPSPVNQTQKATRSKLIPALRCVLPREWADAISSSISSQARAELSQQVDDFEGMRMAIANVFSRRENPHEELGYLYPQQDASCKTIFNIMDSSGQYSGVTIGIEGGPNFYITITVNKLEGGKWVKRGTFTGDFKALRYKFGARTLIEASKEQLRKLGVK